MAAVLLAAAQDAGGASAIAPVAERWLASGAPACSVVTGPAARVFESRGVPALHPPIEGEAMAALRRMAAEILDRERPDVVLVGTSWGPAIDKAVVAEAGQRHVPTLAVIDGWGYYRERFSDIDGMDEGLVYLTDRVAVMDETIRREAEEAGIPSSRLVVTGQPHFDDLRERAASARDEGDRLRRTVSDGDPIIVFASERLACDFPPGSPWYRGYTEREAWSGLRVAASCLEFPVALVAKLHPQEESWAGEDDAVVWKGVPSLSAIGAADVVVGMTSTFLLEAALLGKPTISFQPGDRAAIECLSLRLGLTSLARTVPELHATLRTALSSSAAKSVAVPAWADGGAAPRVIDQLHALMSSSPKTVVR